MCILIGNTNHRPKEASTHIGTFVFPAWNPSLEGVGDDTVGSRNTNGENSHPVLAASFGSERGHEGHREASVADDVKELIRPEPAEIWMASER